MSHRRYNFWLSVQVFGCLYLEYTRTKVTFGYIFMVFHQRTASVFLVLFLVVSSTQTTKILNAGCNNISKIAHQNQNVCTNSLIFTKVSLWEYDTENHTAKSNHTEKTNKTTLKSFTKDNHTGIFSLITLKLVCYCCPRMLIPYNPTKNFQRYSYPLFSQFSLVFQCDFQCHVLVVYGLLTKDEKVEFNNNGQGNVLQFLDTSFELPYIKNTMLGLWIGSLRK